MRKIILLIVMLFLASCTNKQNSLELKKESSKKKSEIKEMTTEEYKTNKINELGEIPIMMYHGIVNKTNLETNFIGGNVDKEGYQRTTEAFRNDLEFYYNNNYRMIRLTDYIDGKINVEFGKSPIVLTFDDGLANNIKIDGRDKKGNLIIDPNSAVGILETFKKKYPDYNVTATFFLNGELFHQKEYNKEILIWLVDHGYDIGNHTYNHINFSKVDVITTEAEVGRIYNLFDELIPKQYVNVIALPFGSPYKLEHENMKYIFDTKYRHANYITKSALRVGWKSENSPFSNEFNPKFLKRIRAYDNGGKEFDIDMNFKLLEINRYISDGDNNKIVIPSSMNSKLKNTYNKEILIY